MIFSKREKATKEYVVRCPGKRVTNPLLLTPPKSLLYLTVIEQVSLQGRYQKIKLKSDDFFCRVYRRKYMDFFYMVVEKITSAKLQLIVLTEKINHPITDLT